MEENEFIDALMRVIGAPANQYKTPYARTSKENPKQGFLHMWVIDSEKAARAVYQFLKDENLIKDGK